MDGPDKDALFKFYDYELNRRGFFEAQKEKTIGILFTVASALVAIASIQKDFDRTDFIVGIVLAFLGIFGIVLSAKYHLASRRHRLRSKEFEKLIDTHFGNSMLLSRREAATAEIQKRSRNYGREPSWEAIE